MTDTTAPEPLKINFEFGPCGRCSGSGMHGPKVVQGGVCFQCKGSGERITANGSRAIKAYRELMEQRMGTPAEEIAEGTRVYTDADRLTMGAQIVAYPWAWRTVRDVDVRTQESTNTATGETTVLRTVRLRFKGQADDMTHFKSAPEGEPLLIITPDREAHREIMREVAKRYRGAWLDGEEPPAKPAPRLRKTADVEKAKPEPRTFPNRYAGTCRHCSQAVAAEAGECLRVAGAYVTQHKAGECPEAAEKPAAEQAKPAGPVNRFAGPCYGCEQHVEAEAGELMKIDGKWHPRHHPGQCPKAEEAKPAEQRPPVTEEGLYRGRSNGKLYRVIPGSSGRLYAQEITRTDAGNVRFLYAGGVVHTLSAEDRLTVEEAEKLSQDWDRCIKCGQELTVSRGMGPVCRKKV